MAERTGSSDMLGHLTDAQRRAVLTADRSLLVSAAAGSGKTTVLAQRCAALVCDVPKDKRCRVDELLVVTFTEAAASEMRTRIATAIQKRLTASPRNDYLREQLYLVDNASISTIHAFCRSLIQRWFPQAGVDPQVSVLAEDEAELLRHEVLEALFLDLYAADNDASRSFQALVDDYGSGRDSQLVPTVLHLHRFINSLPDSQGWLADVVDKIDPERRDHLLADVDTCQQARLRRELSLQMEHCVELAATIRQCWPIAEMHAETIEEQYWQLKKWYEVLRHSPTDAWQSVADEIREHKYASKRRPSRLSDEEKAAFDAAKKLSDRMKELFQKRLRDVICQFSAEEYCQGLALIAPHVRTLAELVTEFSRRYAIAKNAQAVMDFDDLQRSAYCLLTRDGEHDIASDVARQLQQQYRYICVDEFQDVDPLQWAILRVISRDSVDGAEGNLFTVGDIKQSIYRFRLAEPQLFTDRLAELSAEDTPGEVIYLQENFRSRSEIIDAINIIFRPLMRQSFGGSDYDASAELHTGLRYPEKAPGPLFGRPAVEMHLLEPVTSQTETGAGNDDASGGDDTSADTDELEGIEREAFLIARRIQQWMGDNPTKQHWHVAERPASPNEPGVTRPIEYRDIVILLRSMPYKAEPIAEVLGRMGIPVRIERAEASIDSTEFRDVLSLLQVLDNKQQDIPLAAVMRSPLLPETFNESDLLKIRLLDRDNGVPFHAVVERYARKGPDARLRGRLEIVLAFLDRYRERIRQAPVAEVLWEVYEETNYLAYVSGLPSGRQRREHLLRLHELARQFGRFARQGLRRFLRFIEELIASGRQPQQAAGVSATDNVVRIMTVHASKGLEFPVVFLADVSKQFNLKDLYGPVLVDRKYGIAMQAADAERRIRYPTLIHQLASDHSRRENLSEELRVLYVALTRAREHLCVVGRMSLAEIAAYRGRCAKPGEESKCLSQLQLESAKSAASWLLPAVCAAPAEMVRWLGEQSSNDDQALFAIYIHERAMTDRWRIPAALDVSRAASLLQLAKLRPLPADEQVATDEQVDGLIQALAWDYPALELTTVSARITVSELKRRWDPICDPQERHTNVAHRETSLPRPAFLQQEPIESPTRLGIATHRFLQLVDLSRVCDAKDLKCQCQELVEQGRLSADDASDIVMDGVVWFFGSDLGRRVRAHSSQVRREVAFVSHVSPEEIDAYVRPFDERDAVLIRGMVDLVLEGDEGLQIIDYKTDSVMVEQCAERARSYQSQMDHYASALRAIYKCPVTSRWLVFLRAQQIIDCG